MLYTYLHKYKYRINTEWEDDTTEWEDADW